MQLSITTVLWGLIWIDLHERQRFGKFSQICINFHNVGENLHVFAVGLYIFIKTSKNLPEISGDLYEFPQSSHGWFGFACSQALPPKHQRTCISGCQTDDII